MRRSNPVARILALAALVGAAIIVISILSSGLSSDSEPVAEEASTVIEQPNANRQRRRPAQYVVQNGDTLIAISDRTGVSVDRLQELNPDIDPQILVSGQRLRLR